MKPTKKTQNFLTAIIDDDLERGTYGDRVATRFPPEPNGYLHIGHAKSICLNFGLARDYQGVCHLRFDDTNPVKEDTEYVRSIQEDIRWLGFDWGENLFNASDYFEKMYELAEGLIQSGQAYVCSLSDSEIREYRGSVTEPGRDSPYRSRSVEENLDLFRRMRAGEFPDGAHVLRARIDMAAANMKMRDPLLYRIRHVTHHRTGDTWCIYPMYDYAHCLGDAIEKITHSICTLEFENNRELYDWVIEATGIDWVPHQYEFARLGLGHTIMSKRKLLTLVEEGHVDGWDDPRMPTIAGLRRRGVRASAIRAFCELIGVAKANSTVDVGKLEYCIREDLNHASPRVMCVLDPLRVVITNYPEGEEETLDASYWPKDVPREGSRPLPFTRELFIDRADFMENPPKGYYRLSPGGSVRLRYGYIITCNEVVTCPDTGAITELHCSYDAETRSGKSSGDKKVKGTIHWVSASHSVAAEVRLYDRLFTSEKPDLEEGDFLDYLNPESRVILKQARVEPSLSDCEPGAHFQFERHGYFIADAADSGPDRLVFNRVVTLRDSWAKKVAKTSSKPQAIATPATKASAPSSSSDKARTKKASPATLRARARAKDNRLEEKFAHYQSDLGLTEHSADLLTADRPLVAFFEDACEALDNPTLIAKWIVNNLLALLKDRRADELPFTGRQFAELVEAVDSQTISGRAAKDVIEYMLAGEGSPSEIIAARGLAQMQSDDALIPVIDAVLTAHPDMVANYRGGKTKLLGFFVGQVMKSTGGSANPAAVKTLLEKALQP